MDNLTNLVSTLKAAAAAKDNATITTCLYTLAASDLSTPHLPNADIERQLRVTLMRTLLQIGRTQDPQKSMASEYIKRLRTGGDASPQPFATVPPPPDDMTITPLAPSQRIINRNDMTAMKEHIMRGMYRERSTKTGKLGVGMVKTDFPIRSSQTFGHNSIPVGTWWPYRQCLRRDGAHGSYMAGIYGADAEGAMSVVSCGGVGYEAGDVDNGDVLEYSGSAGDGKTTGMLSTSLRTGRPVRVIRGAGSGGGSMWAPEVGFRYDGLYEIVGVDEERSPSVYTLKRRAGQERLGDIVERSPSRVEKEAYKSLEEE